MTFCFSELIQWDQNGDTVSFWDSAGVKPIKQAWRQRKKEESADQAFVWILLCDCGQNI